MIDACVGGWGDDGCLCSGRGVTMHGCLSVCVCRGVNGKMSASTSREN